MALSHLPLSVSTAFDRIAAWLDPRSGARLSVIMLGMLLASGRRTVTTWFLRRRHPRRLPPGIRHRLRRGPRLRGRLPRRPARRQAAAGCKRLLLAIDDTPTPRYGPMVEGCGYHHNPTPGPAGGKLLYGHVWVTLAALAKHERFGTIALPVQAQLYVREADLPGLPPERPREFRTKLEMAVAQLEWARPWVASDTEQLWVVADGGYAKRPFLGGASRAGFTVVSRLRKDAALYSLPEPKPAGRRGPQATYGKERVSLAKRAGQTRAWQQVECVQYGERVTKKVKTFLATWRPAGGAVRVVLVEEEGGWIPFFSTDAGATAADVLEAMADRNAQEQSFKDVKEVWVPASSRCATSTAARVAST